MQIANFIKNNDVYLVTHNGIVSTGYATIYEDGSLFIGTHGRMYEIDDSYSVTGLSNNSVTYSDPIGDSTFTIKILEVTDANALYPNRIKTFNDIDSLTLTVREGLMAADSYAPNVADTSDVLSFTVDDNNNVLELIRTTDDGDLFFRENGDWTMVQEDDEAPTIYDQKVIDIDKNDINDALKMWDDSQVSGKDVAYDEITPFADIAQ